MKERLLERLKAKLTYINRCDVIVGELGQIPCTAFFFQLSILFGMRIGNFVDRPVEYPLLAHKLFKEKMNWSVSVAPLNSNYKSLRLAIPFVFIHITCPLQRTMLLKARMGSGEWDWGMGPGNGTGSGEWKGRMERVLSICKTSLISKANCVVSMLYTFIKYATISQSESLRLVTSVG